MAEKPRYERTATKKERNETTKRRFVVYLRGVGGGECLVVAVDSLHVGG